jgi:hypothetical protein
MSRFERAAARTPLVSIGLPVFNGEALLDDTIRSVLAQSFEDFELIICDNASGDRTAELCRDRASGERRIRYFRNLHHVSVATNYNLAFSHARGRYFKWLAQDELLLPSYLERTRSVLDQRADVVLCNTLMCRIDPAGKALGQHDSALHRADLPGCAARFAWMVSGLPSCADFFGLIRTESLRVSLLHGSYSGARRALLAQLALRGRVAQLPAPLLQMREYPHRQPAWQEPGASSKSLRRAYLRMLTREALPIGDRLRCYAVLVSWWANRSAVARAARDALAMALPRAVAARSQTGDAEDPVSR